MNPPPDSPLIPLAPEDPADPRIRQAFEKIAGALGFVPNLVRLWSRAPHLVGALVELELAIASEGKVPIDLKELAMMRTSELNGCPYCISYHRARLHDLGEDQARSEALSRRTLGDLFTQEERAVLQLADEMTLDIRARPETVQRVRGLFGDDGAVELMAAIALLNFDNRMAYSANLPPDDR
jgi:uncharacterized peroxidase-related enzyme